MANEKCLSVIILVTIITIVQTKSVGNLPQAVNAVSVSSNATNQHIDLKEMLIGLRAKYQNTLLNESTLPFLSNCRFVYTTTSAPLLTGQPSAVPQPNLLCLVYFDMVHNLGKSGYNDYQTAISVNDTLKAYDNKTLVDNFCDLFHGELPTETEFRAFETKLMPNIKGSWEILKDRSTCSLFCYELDSKTFQTHIRPVCKLISGGYRVLTQHLNDKDPLPDQSQKPTITKIVDGALPLAVSVIANKDDSVKADVVPLSNSEAAVNVVPAGEPVAVLPAAVVNPEPAVAPPAPVVAPIDTQNSNNAAPLPIVKALEPVVPESINAAAELASAFATSPAKPVIVPDLSSRAQSVSVSPTPTVNRTIENAAVPISNDKSSTKEMKSTQKDSDTFVDQGEANEEIEIPQDEEEAYGDDKESNVMSIKPKQPINEEEDNPDDDDSDNLLTQNVQLQPEVQHNNIRLDKQHIDVVSGDSQPSLNGEQAEIVGTDPFFQDESSNFFSYFMFALLATAIVYVAYHNKSKIMALMLEGRRSRSNSSRGGRRKHRAAYRKLDCNLEEAFLSSGKVSSSQVIY